MNFELNDEQRMWQEAVQAFCDRELRPRAAEIDEEERLDPQVLSGLAALGVFGMSISQEYGGSEVDALSSALAIEALGWACGSTALSMAAHNGLGCAPIAAYGSPEQQARWLPGLASGELGLGALALTEPEGGSDLLGSVHTRAVLENGEWRIDGAKAWITNASLAPWIVTLCRTDPEAETESLSLIVVPTDSPGLHIHPKERKLGVRGSPTHALTFENVRVPADHVLGEPGQGIYQTLEILDAGRINIGALSLGLARAAFEAALDYAQQRQAFGQPLAGKQSIQFRLADMALAIDSARWMVWHAAWLRDEGRPYSKQAAEAKLLATEMAEKVAREAIQIHGGYGYSREFPLERYYRDARLMTIGEGTSEIMRLVIARRLLASV